RRHKTSMEKQGEKDKKHNQVAVRRFLPGQRISQKGADRDSDGRPDNRNKHRNAKSAQNLQSSCEQIFISRRAEHAGNERISVRQYGILIRQGGRDQQDKREDACCREQEKREMAD